MAISFKLERLPFRISRKLQLSRVFGYPEQVQIVPTNACNLRCMQCPKTWYDTDNRHLKREVYDRVRDQILPHPHVRVLNLQGLGEPMLSPLFSEMLDDAIRFGLQVHFVTNTTFFKEQYIEKCVAAGSHVTVSIDGATNETHTASRPGNNLVGVLNTLAALKRQRDRHPNTGFELHLNTVVTTKNVDEIDRILEYGIEYGASDYQLINPGVGPRTDEFAKAAIGNHPQPLASLLPTLRNKATSHGIHIHFPEFIQSYSGTDPDPASQTSESGKTISKSTDSGRLFPGKCMDPWNTVYIDVDGWIRPCCRAIWIGMGNILVEPFDKIWNNEPYALLRRTVNSNNPPSFCRTCNIGWGITRGDERFVEKLESRGITLPEPPHIGKVYPGMNPPPSDDDLQESKPKSEPNRIGKRNRTDSQMETPPHPNE